MDTSSFRRSSTVFLFVVSITISVVGGSVVLADAAASGGDAGDTRSGATVIEGENTRVNEVVTAGDSDWYAVELEEGQRLSVRLTHSGNRSEILSVGLYGPSGKRISTHTSPRRSQTPVTGNDTATQTSMDHTIGQPGVYYVKVTTVNKNARRTPYSLTVTVQSPDNNDSTTTPDDNDSTTTPNDNDSTTTPDDNDSTTIPDNRQATPIESGETVKGNITGGDHEYYSIRTEAGDVLSIETTFNAARSSGTVYVYGPDGERIRNATDGNIRRITVENGGRYTIVLVSDGTPLTYTLTATLSSNKSKIRHIKTSQTVSGTIRSKGQMDWYAVDLEEGQGFTIRLEHTNRKDPSTEMSFVVYNPNRKKIGEKPFDRPVRAYHTGPAASSAYGGDVAKRSGTYYIGVKGNTGANYSLTVDTVKLDEHDPNEQATSATPISGRTTVSGVLTGYDRDVYAIDLQKGESVTIEYSSTGAIQPSLWVAGPRVVKTAKPIGDYSFGAYTIASSGTKNSLTFTANRTGTYYIKVVPYFERSTAATFFESAEYELSLQRSDGSKQKLSVSQLRTATDAPSTETVALNTSVRTPPPTPTSTTTPTPTTTSTPTTTATTPTSETMATQTTNENDETPPTTTTDGPGFGTLLALVGLGGGVWWYRGRQG